VTIDRVEVQYQARYEQVLIPLAKRLERHLLDTVSGYPRIDRITARAKTVGRFLQKAHKKENDAPKYSDFLNQIQDQIGARIVTFYLRDVVALSEKIEKYFSPIEARTVIPDSPNEFGYEGKHYIMFIPDDIKEPTWESDQCPNFFELQIKTLFQHAWGEADHDLAYKATTILSPDQHRRVAFTAAQAWGADRMFAELEQELGLEDPPWVQ
jgi:putative GTP pyrophosphokinase